MVDAKEGGFALVAALWLIVAVGVLIAEFGLQSRVRRLSTINAVAEARARAAASAGVEHAVARLWKLAEEAERPQGHSAFARWNRIDRLLADLDSVALASDAHYRVRASDVGRRLSLNAASSAELRRLFTAAGVDRHAAEIAAQSILDWRDADDLHRLHGAEWEDHYRHLTPPVRPRNGEFRSVGELRRVRGIGGIYERIAPFLTVLGDGRVNLNAAPPQVLAALPGLTPEAVDLILSRRSLAPLTNLFELEPHLSPASRHVFLHEFAALAARASFAPRQIEVRATGAAGGSDLRVTVRALVVREAGRVRIAWRHGR